MNKIFDHAKEGKFKDIQGYFFENMLFSRNFQDFQGNFKNSRKFKEIQECGHLCNIGPTGRQAGSTKHG